MASGRVLFLCVANSARSQMAEGLARQRGWVGVQSAGSTPSQVHPLARTALEEVGVDTTDHRSKSVDGIDPGSVELVVTLCEDEVCPAWLGTAERLHWPLPDPAGDGPSTLDRFRTVRDEIGRRLASLAAERGWE